MNLPFNLPSQQFLLQSKLASYSCAKSEDNAKLVISAVFNMEIPLADAQKLLQASEQRIQAIQNFNPEAALTQANADLAALRDALN